MNPFQHELPVFKRDHRLTGERVWSAQQLEWVKKQNNYLGF